MVSINTNNGIERQNESLKYQYLKDRNNNSLSGMITILIEEFLPDKYRKYVELNTRCSEGYRRYNSEVPKYLYNKPRLFLNHCRQRLTHAGDVQLQHIKIVDDDRELVFADPNTHNSEVNEESIEYPEAPRDPQAQRAARPNPKAKENTESQLRQEAMACWETLKGLALMTYNVESINALKELNSSLTTLLNKQLMKRKTCPAMVRNIVVRLLGILTFHYLYVPRKRDLKTELENLHP
ncbi:hypothetical protein OS493_000669 [Desmophyllum pertusum]|uniref:Uncharacterized protein n=1 Tax=Desmophyllum pertusum TaxID=174260 RepID=A0A9X0A8P3_9CNID|nr:hypothetical protein OS493_000669 [Desmophyllum pertusum]